MNDGTSVKVLDLVKHNQDRLSSCAEDLDGAWQDLQQNAFHHDNWTEIAPTNEEQRLQDAEEDTDQDEYCQVDGED